MTDTSRTWTDTPRTEKVVGEVPLYWNNGWMAPVIELAQQLERELAAQKGALSESPNIGRWVSTGERLPEDGQMVLGYWPPTSVSPVSMEALTYLAADAPDSHDAWRDYIDQDTDEPTHWMPLPEAPK